MAGGSSPSPGVERDPFLDENVRVSSPESSSAEGSRPGSAGGGRVRFGPGEAVDQSGNRTAFNIRDSGSPSEYGLLTTISNPSSPIQINLDSYFATDRNGDSSNSPNPPDPPAIITDPVRNPVRATLPAPPRSVYKKPRFDEADELNEKYDDFQPRNERTSKYGGSFSAPNSARSSPTLNAFSVGAGQAQGAVPVEDIPMLNIHGNPISTPGNKTVNTEVEKPNVTATTEAHDLVRQHTRRGAPPRFYAHKVNQPQSGFSTPIEHGHGDYVEKPEQFRGGVLSSLLTLYNNSSSSSDIRGHKPTPSIASTSASGRTTPKWYSKSANNSTTSLGSLLAATGTANASAMLGAPPTAVAPGLGRKERPRLGARSHSGGLVDKLKNMSRTNLDQEIRITVHIAELLQRQRYIIKICRALMLYGAPTHRLEEALKMTARVLAIDAQFLYIPGCMIITFGDQSTHTSEMQIVRTAQGLDFGKLSDVHTVYKEVIHDVIGVEEANQRLDEIFKRKPKHSPWVQVLIYGVASATVGPFGFKARFIDMPILFILGCTLGFMQLIMAPKSELYANVFEVSAAIVISFLSRMFGSIRGGELFCFSALTQASIALILPGYIILCGSLELQSRNIVAGSVRMFYAIIYSLFLGFGITIGSALYGLIDKQATSVTSCPHPVDYRWNFFFVPLFAMCLLSVNQARWRQAPVMVVIALAGYVVNYFSGLRFSAQPQLASGLGAFTVGVLGNLYSRVGHGLAFAAMLPAIFVQVPSGLAAQGSLLAGLESANAIAGNSTIPTTSSAETNSIMFEFGFSMIQIAIGITVGLFAAALVVYPIPKKRSGLFSF